MEGSCTCKTEPTCGIRFFLGLGPETKALDFTIEPGTAVSIILLAHQHLAWKLPTELSTTQGPFLREVFWMDLAPLLRLGQPGFNVEEVFNAKPAYRRMLDGT